MHVRLIYRRIEHHASHSGYDVLAKYVRGQDYRRGLLYRLASRLPERFIGKVRAFNSDWYRRESLFTELELCGRFLVPAKRLYHMLYGEDALRLSPRWRPRFNNKLVASFHQPPAIFDSLPFFRDKSFLRRLDGVITLCVEQERYFQGLMPASQVFRVPHGVECGYWQPDPASKRRDTPTFLTVGWWLRDIDLLKSTIRRVHEIDTRVQFRIVTFKHLWDHFAGLPNVTLLGGIADHELREEYRTATALFLPLKDVTANNAVLETMACGTGVVATAKGGLPDYVSDACALQLPPGDVEAAARALLEVAGDRQLADRMGRAARERALEFDWPVVAERMDYVYRRILGLPCRDYFHAEERRPRTICLLTEEYPPESGWGGIATHNYNLARGLSRLGHRVLVVAGGGDGSVTREGRVEVHRVAFRPKRGLVRRLHERWVRGFLGRRYPEFVRRLEFALAAYKKFRLLQRCQPIHVIETPEYYGSAWFVQRLLRRYPVVVKLHTPTELNCHLNSLPVTRDVKLASLFEKGSTRLADLVVAPSRKMITAAAEHWLPGLNGVELLENPIDTDTFRPGEQAWSGGPKVFLYSGRLEYRKGVQVLAQAFERIAGQCPDVEVHFAGHDTRTFRHGDDVLFFLDYVERLGLSPQTRQRLRFLGRQTREALIPLYQSAYACVIPSQSFENFPYSCLEAMSCGKAVLVTDTGGMTEMAADGVCGLHVRANDPEALAAAMRRLADDPQLARRMGEASRRVVLERYSTEKMTEKALATYERLIRAARYA